MTTIKTASGREFPCEGISLIQTPERAYVRVTGAGIGEVATVFSDPLETALLECDGVTLTGYTKLLAIIPEGENIRLNLTRGEIV